MGLNPLSNKLYQSSELGGGGKGRPLGSGS